MNVRYGKNKRKAISPVLATVILIAITLIAAIAIAGFVFGLFGSFTSTAQVSVTQTALVSTGTGASGTIVASNTGTSNAAINAISLTYGGQTCNPLTGALPSVTAGSSAPITLTAIQTTGHCLTQPTSGEQFTGSLALSNGGSAQFTGTFQ
jgi:flagellin-like protein